MLYLHNDFKGSGNSPSPLPRERVAWSQVCHVDLLRGKNSSSVGSFWDITNNCEPKGEGT